MKNTIVIDPGTYSVKTGYAGSSEPRSIIPTIVGTGKPNTNLVGIQNKNYFVGNEALAKANLLNLVNPIEDGVIRQWDLFQELLDHMFKNELHMFPNESCVLFTEKPHITVKIKQKMAQMMFETFESGAFFSCQQSVLSLFGIGRMTGLVYDGGEGDGNVVPVYEGYTIPQAVIRTPLGGRFLFQHLEQVLSEKGQHIIPESISAIKEKALYIPLDFQAEEQAENSEIDVRLPNGKTFSCGKEQFTVPEVLFDPSRANSNIDGLHQVLFNSVMRCDIDIRQDLYKNILLSGGTAMIPGLAERIEKEVIALAPPSMQIRVFAPPERKISPWVGGSVLGTMDFFHKDMAVKKSEYEEGGPSIIKLRCHS